MTQDFNSENPVERTPMESLILLLVILGLSDRQLVYEEQIKIKSIISHHFPNHSQQRYEELLQTNIENVKNIDLKSQMELLDIVSEELKVHYSGTDILPTIYTELQELLEADGIVYSFEAQLLELVNKVWN